MSMVHRWCLPDPFRGTGIAVAGYAGGHGGFQDNWLVNVGRASGTGGCSHRLIGGHPVCTAVPDWPRHRVRVAVLDGMGGQSLGRCAAETAAARLATLPPLDSTTVLRSAVIEVHATLQTWLGGPGRGGTTLVLVELDLATNTAMLVHVGDSRAYCHSPGAVGVCTETVQGLDNWTALTHDHRVAEFAWRDGELDDGAYNTILRTPTQRLAQAVGFGSMGAFSRRERRINPALRIDAPPLPHADIAEWRLGAGDRLVLASDGVFTDPDLVQPLFNTGCAQAAAETLAARTGPANNHLSDDATMLTVALDGPTVA